MKTFNSQKGFTLIETLIYIALFSVLIGGAMVGVYGVIEGSDRANARSIAEQEGIFILRKLNWAMNGANNATVSGNTLTITGDSTLTFSVNGTNLELNGILLNSENVKVDSVSFVEIPSSGGKPKAVSASFTVTGTKNNAQSFSTTKFLR